MEAAANRFQFAEGDVTYLSRRDGFSNYNQAAAAPADYELDGTVQGNGTYDPTEYNRADDVMPITGAKNGLELFDLRGADYDDPRWEMLLDQVTVDEMVDLIAFGGHQNAAVNSAGKIRILDTDGPAGVNSSTLGAFGTGFCSEVVLAQTWNVDLAVDYAKAMGQEFKDFHITGWYAPVSYTHLDVYKRQGGATCPWQCIPSWKTMILRAKPSCLLPLMREAAWHQQKAVLQAPAPAPRCWTALPSVALSHKILRRKQRTRL